MPNVTINGTVISVVKNTLISDCIKMAKVSLPCGGNGICGKCKIAVSGDVSPLTDEEKRLLTPMEMERGIRLACFTRALSDCTIQPQIEEISQICTSTRSVEIADNTRCFRFGAAVDIGTTTVAASLYDTTGRCVATETAVNTQIAYGTDVLSRVQAATAGKETELSATIRTCIDDVLCRLAAAVQIDIKHIDAVVATGNTAMLCLFTGTAVDPLQKAPFYSHRYFGETVTAAECGLQDLSADTPIYLPQCLDAFLGADLVCAILAIGMCDCESTSLLVDVGTNGEMALWHDGTLYVCSTAAGPAFEGVGVACGTAAVDGAIEHVKIVNHSLFTRTIRGGLATGICGSGLIDAMACLLDLDELGNDGTLSLESYPLTDSINLTRADIHALVVAKSAIRSGIETLLHRADITAEEVDCLYLAGGFGNTLNLRNAARIGLLPRGLEHKVTFVGNAALDGAAELLFRPNCEGISTWHKVELATDSYFSDAFIRNMRFKETSL